MKRHITSSIAGASAFAMLMATSSLAQVSKPGGDIELTGKWPALNISESRYYTLHCREGRRLYRHPTRVDKVVCVGFSVNASARDCEGGRAGKEIMAQRGPDYCVYRGAHLHTPVCPSMLGTGGKTVQRGQDVCGLKGSSTKPRCERHHMYVPDRRGNEDLCLPIKINLKCKSGNRRWQDSDGFKDQCGLFVYPRPTIS